ncbi:MAG TPA: type II toxin-antitoxin system VapC family toxin [Caulobacteraceae bacterium]
MRLLLDTHVAIWAVIGHSRLGSQAKDLLQDDDNELFVSAVSLWEIAIKRRVTRKTASMPISCDEAIAAFQEAGFDLMAVTPAHAAAVEKLPMLHRDPFDHLLLGQALSERMRLVTHDAHLAAYDGSIIRV